MNIFLTTCSIREARLVKIIFFIQYIAARALEANCQGSLLTNPAVQDRLDYNVCHQF